MNIFREFSWIQFQQLNEIRNLPLNEQVKYYNQYLNDLNIARQSWIIYQNKGPHSPTPTPPSVEGFLLQEDLFDILQEDGNKIIITT
jgi:hypothetical protein